ncbi:MAG: cyclodeaminase/cyclohydrolase family protein [Vulcanimicrobiaceae bacterium]
MEIETYLESLAAATPTPGGGSAAAIVAAAGAALVAMVARIGLANPTYAAQHDACNTIVEKADKLRVRALAARFEDEAAYGAVVAAMALPKASAEEKTVRSEALQAALTGAAAAPLDAAEIAKLVAVLADRAVALGNVKLIGDLGTAAEFAQAALNSAAYNVRSNHTYMKDRTIIAQQERELARLERDTAQSVKRVRFEVARSFATA